MDDAHGVRVLPALAGVGAPWWKPSAHGVLAGLTAAVRPGHIARAALEGIAWRVADVVETIREEGPVEVLRVDGGLTRDPLLLQLQDRGRLDLDDPVSRWLPNVPRADEITLRMLASATSGYYVSHRRRRLAS